MQERTHAQAKTTTLIWSIRAAVAGMLAILLAATVADGAEAKKLRFKYAKASSRAALPYSTGGVSVYFQFKLKGKAGTTRNLDVAVIRKGSGLSRLIEVPGAPVARKLAVGWDGLNANGKPSKPGGYVFKVRHPKSGKNVRMKKVRGKRSFSLRNSIFPVRGPHNYGGSSAAFGAPRSGHSHQGQDVFASCGTKMVAPEAGIVQAKSFQSSAGHYVVIRLSAGGRDAVFMHLQKASWVTPGTKVFPGQQIGKVGESGNAQGCHLHFELWTAPGWYTGGAPYDPLPTLRAWDSRS